MPLDSKPLAVAAKVRFSKGFDDDFFVMLRERTYVTLAVIHTNSIEVEAIISPLAKLKGKEKKAIYYKIFTL